MRLMNKVSIVTGAGRGIGEAIARRLSEEGAKVVISDVDMPAAENVARELKDSGREAIAIKANVANKAEVDEMVKKVMDVFGRVDILVNNAGMSVVGVSAELEESRWRQGIDVMLTGVFFCSQAAGKEMIKQRSGKIINISSINGIGAFPERVCYNSAKAGVMGLTRVLGCEWARYNINVNAIAPGYVNTYLVQDLVAKGTLDITELETRTPLGRLAECSEIADAVVFLSSEESKYMEGQTIVVDGGWSAYNYLESWLRKSKQTPG
jgi:NAD(P)-dependent dehydrogenase (short-subunit alcohol dehydrogenase family)